MSHSIWLANVDRIEKQEKKIRFIPDEWEELWICLNESEGKVS